MQPRILFRFMNDPSVLDMDLLSRCRQVSADETIPGIKHGLETWIIQHLARFEKSLNPVIHPSQLHELVSTKFLMVM